MHLCQARLGARDPVVKKQSWLGATFSGSNTSCLGLSVVGGPRVCVICHKFSGALFCTEPENLLIGEENQQQSEK